MLELTAPPSPSATERLPLRDRARDRPLRLDGRRASSTSPAAAPRSWCDRLAPDRPARDRHVRRRGRARRAARARSGRTASTCARRSPGSTPAGRRTCPAAGSRASRRSRRSTAARTPAACCSSPTAWRTSASPTTRSSTQMTRASAGDGIGTTTIGFGDGFSEDLLTAMADAGGGGAHFAATPDAAPGDLRAGVRRPALARRAERERGDPPGMGRGRAALDPQRRARRCRSRAASRCSSATPTATRRRRVVFQLRVPRPADPRAGEGRRRRAALRRRSASRSRCTSSPCR